MTRSRSVGLATFAAAVACTAQPLHGQSERTIRPVADHHAHLQSRAVWPLFHGVLPFLVLPADLDGVLRDFEHGWQAADNRAALSALFTADGVLQWGDDWLRGPAAIRIALLGVGGSLRLRPQAFEAGDRLGYIAGAYGFYRDTTWVDEGRYILTLRRTTDGPWRIAAAMMRSTTPPVPPAGDPFSADALIAQLDSSGTRRAAALSLAYQFGATYRQVADERAKVQAENDWVGAEVARYPDRLVGFCSLNPLKDYALEELERCVSHPHLSGLKLHFTTSGVDLLDALHVERLRAVFRLANARRFPIVVHMRTLNPSYGRPDAEAFLNAVLADAPDVPVQIAHLAGWGGYGEETDRALGVFADAAAAGDARVANLWFDLSAVVNPGMSDDLRSRIVGRLRQIGMRRILFAVDGTGTPATAWERLLLLPLDEAERRTLATNLAPWLR